VSYSALSLLRHAFRGHRDWAPAWRSPAPRSAYDVVIVGAGGHGLATAYHLARAGTRSVAVLDKGWLGGGNTGRNTAVIRANYLREPSVRFHARSMALWRELSHTLNYNVMFSPRGQIDLIRTWGKLRDLRRRAAILARHDVDYELIGPDRIRAMVPDLDLGAPGAIAPGEGGKRLPVLAGAWHPDAGIARHDAVAWGYARAADGLGVDIIQDCEVTGLRREGARVTAVETTRGPIRAGRVGVAVAGHAGVLAGMAGFRLPIETWPLVAFVSEPLKPFLHTCINCPATGVYVNQSDKGELVIGGGPDRYRGYAQAGDWDTVETVTRSLLDLFPRLGRVKLLRQWAGMIDVAYDTSPIVSRSPLDNLYLSVGWGSGGFKAIPAGGEAFARLIATGEPDDLIAPFALDRFRAGRPLFETASASARG
jgi:sarcosine oxidase subunit beta